MGPPVHAQHAVLCMYIVPIATALFPVPIPGFSMLHVEKRVLKRSGSTWGRGYLWHCVQ